MSGHSKWSTIHRQKGVADSKRGAVFTKLGKTISVAAREGGSDPDSNFKLRLAIDKAKASNMPKDNIERAIKRGTGELVGGALEEIMYEGFGPGGTAFLVQALTDNRNRTASNIKHLFSEYSGVLGTPGSVAWMFEQKGLIKTDRIAEDIELALIDLGATDVVNEDEESTVYTNPTDLQKIKSALEKRGLPITYAEIEFIAKEKKSTDTATQEKISALFDGFDEDEDISNVYTNADADADANS